jgi:hypothetical protein
MWARAALSNGLLSIVASLTLVTGLTVVVDARNRRRAAMDLRRAETRAPAARRHLRYPSADTQGD